MHKFFYFSAAALLLMATGGCNNSPKDISELKDATPADSMMYYFGEMQGSYYWQDAETDTILKTEEGRREFMKGFRAALDMETDDYAYNKGLQLGLRLAIRLREFKEQYDMNFPEDMLANSLENALRSDTGVNAREAQAGYYKIKDRLDFEKGIKDTDEAKRTLSRTAEQKSYEMVSDTLFAKDITAPTGGMKFKDGDKVAISLTSSTVDGREIGRQFPDTITIGEGRVPRVVCLAIHTMTNGQTRTFLTTPRTLFGNQYSRYKLNAYEPVMFTVKATRN